MDEIIEWVAIWPRIDWPSRPSNYPTLLRCCLVCRQWLPASRRGLFQHVLLPRPTNYNTFVSDVLSQDSMRVYLSRVHTLELRKYETCGPCPIPFAYAFVGHLPNLTTLHVNRGGSKTHLCCHPRTSLALFQFPSIRELTLHETDFPSFADLRRTLMSLPNLTDLTIWTDVRWPLPIAELSPHLRYGTSTSSRPKLVGLTYAWTSPGDKEWASQFLTWLASTSTSLSLRRLALHMDSRIDTYGGLCGPAFIHSVARCVEELTLFNPTDDGKSVW